MKFNTWYKYQKTRGEHKFYYPECQGFAPAQIHKDKSYASYNDETKVFFLQYFLRGIGEPFKQRKQVQHTLKRHFGCTGDTILVTDQQKETKKETTFVKLEFYAICNLPTNEMMVGVAKLINKVCDV